MRAESSRKPKRKGTMQKLGDYLTTTMSTLIIDQQRIKLSQKNGNVIAQVECHNKERNCLTGDLEFQGVCCYFTLTDSKGTRLRDHYCFNADLNKLEYMFSDEFVVPQPKKPAVTFTLRDVEYGLHTNGEYVEISQNGASIARLPCTDREYSVFSGKRIPVRQIHLTVNPCYNRPELTDNPLVRFLFVCV